MSLRCLPEPGAAALRRAFTMMAVFGVAAHAHAQYEPPADYYATVTGNPVTLEAELHLIASDDYWASLTGPGGAFEPDGSGHRVVSYDDLRQALPIVDRDPSNPSNVILAYNGASVQGAWSTGGTIWNREHRWPKSWGLGTSGPDYSDMFQLAPCNPAINSDRNNYAFGTVGSSGSYSLSVPYWYPGDSDVPGGPDFGDDTGDAARVLFYMAVRYDGSEPDTMDLDVRNGVHGQVGSTYHGGDLASALTWHYADPPSMHERRRNHTVFSSVDNPTYYQGNRNPFIDRPEFVWPVFGAGPSDSRLYVGAVQPADGASDLTVDFGIVPIGSPLPAPQPVMLNKTGDAPTYFELTAAGAATSPSEGRFNVFENGPGAASISVNLAPDTTATAGFKVGTLTIDNLDPSSAGAGTGALDGDDVIHVLVSVVSPCNDPFADADGDGDVDQTDFGAFQLCVTGSTDPDGLFDPWVCGCFDRDGDFDVDADDFGWFQACVSGANVPADPACDD